MKLSLWLSVLFLFSASSITNAGSAVWNLNSASGDWNTATNWTPATIPNGPSDTATFSISSTTSIGISTGVEVNSVLFTSAADGFAITISEGWFLTLSGVGIVNNSGVTQTFILAPSIAANTVMQFTNSAKAGSSASYSLGSDGIIYFLDSTSADSSSFLLNDSAQIDFNGSATAENGSFIFNGGDLFGPAVYFSDDSNAGNGTFTLNGGGAFCACIFYTSGTSAGHSVFTVNGAGPNSNGASFVAFNSGSADSATLIANSGVIGGYGGGVISLAGDSIGATSRIELFGNGKGDLTDGTLNITGHFSPGVAIGSLEGNGLVLLGANRLTIGSNNLDTVFSGILQDYGQDGSLAKIGIGKLTMTGANSYTGGTSVNAGALIAANQNGSATGSGLVKVNAGTLGGRGTIAGSVKVGTGNGAGAFLEPSVGSSKPTTLTLQNSVTFRSDSTYTYKLNTKKAKADQLSANGVTIESDSQFVFRAVANKRLTAGAVFTVISNTSGTPIGGTFANLVDGSTFTAGRNKFQSSYSGGDGNDLTLTVVP